MNKTNTTIQAASQNPEIKEKLHDLISHFDTAMLVTEAKNSSIRARPMAIAEIEHVADLYFATSKDAAKIDELEAHPDVAVVMQGDNRYLSISGRIRVEQDRNKIHELYSPAWDLWFPEGKNDPNITLLHFVPKTAEYWDMHGSRQLEYIWEAGKALLKGKTIDEENAGKHEKVAL